MRTEHAGALQAIAREGREKLEGKRRQIAQGHKRWRKGSGLRRREREKVRMYHMPAEENRVGSSQQTWEEGVYEQIEVKAMTTGIFRPESEPTIRAKAENTREGKAARNRDVTKGFILGEHRHGEEEQQKRECNPPTTSFEIMKIHWKWNSTFNTLFTRNELSSRGRGRHFRGT